MALVSIPEAARLVRKQRATLDADIERGHLSKTVAENGEAVVDTSELLRAYGRLYPDDDEQARQSNEAMRIALLEERAHSLERVLALEAELRRVKDQVATELRARLADKENLIKVLESKLLFLEYDREVDAIPTLDPADHPSRDHRSGHAARSHRPAWWTRIFRKR
jgi:hypothetical protein